MYGPGLEQAKIGLVGSIDTQKTKQYERNLVIHQYVSSILELNDNWELGRMTISHPKFFQSTISYPNT